uniref:EARP complex and GARP complex interacting protein 1 n=1 Tax=Rattus norvegicus TaxID=10116 RepID=A0A8I6AQG0_RAT
MEDDAPVIYGLEFQIRVNSGMGVSISQGVLQTTMIC